MLLTTVPFLSVSLMIFGTAVLDIIFITNSEVSRYITVICLLVFMFFFGLALATAPWTINSEIYPVRNIQLNVRSTGISISTTANWGSNFLLSFFVLIVIENQIGNIILWYFFAILVISGWVFIEKMVPETKGISIEETLALFNLKKILKLVLKKDPRRAENGT